MKTNLYKQQGMTLTELMVAVTIGLIVSAAVAGLFLQTTASNNQNDEITYLQDNGRYALKLIADDLEMSNFWAGLPASNRTRIGFENTSVAQNSGNPTIVDTIDGDVNTLCGNGAATTNADENWHYSVTQPIEILIATSGADAITAYPCVNNDDDKVSIIDGVDVLMVKRTKGLEESSNQTNGRPYIRGNRTVATLHKYVSGSTSAPPSGYFDWQYLNHIYYIARRYNNTPGDCPSCPPLLVRQALKEPGITPHTSDPAADDPEFYTEVIAEGIEQFHIMFGIDTDGNAEVDTFTSTPTNAQLLNTVVAKIYVLARGQSEVMGYTNKKKYTLGDRIVNANDGYYRRVFSTTVVMKNTEAVLQMAAM